MFQYYDCTSTITGLTPFMILLTIKSRLKTIFRSNFSQSQYLTLLLGRKSLKIQTKKAPMLVTWRSVSSIYVSTRKVKNV